ncbi:MAG: hypothetical protein WEA80_11370 [Gemmatimonadaceae bacterium]
MKATTAVGAVVETVELIARVPKEQGSGNGTNYTPPPRPCALEHSETNYLILRDGAIPQVQAVRPDSDQLPGTLEASGSFKTNHLTYSDLLGQVGRALPWSHLSVGSRDPSQKHQAEQKSR